MFAGEKLRLLGCYVLSTGKLSPTFRKGVLCPCSETRSLRKCVKMKTDGMRFFGRSVSLQA